MDTILQLSHRMAHNSSPSASDVMKFSPTDSLKMTNRDNKRIERRKPNWSESENVYLLDQFAMHREILTCKATDASTNLRKQEIWRLICANLNQNNTLVRRTPAEVRRKWKNLVTAAKKEVWEMRHQIHISGGSGTNGRKISELSQRVLQLHSSGNINNQSNGIYGTLLSAGLLGNAGGDKFSSKYADYMEDKSFIPAHFTPIITLSESNNNHIISVNHGDGPPSPRMSDEDEEDQESSDSRNATEFMSDSGVNDQEGMDLRVNVSTRHSYASSNSHSRSGRSMHNNTAGHLSAQLHHRDSLLSRGGVLPGDLGDDDEELLEDDEEVELAMEKRYASYNGQLSNGGTITSSGGKHGHGHNALSNFHSANNAGLTNGPSAAAAAAAASVLLERQHLQHLQQLATAASLRPALNTNNTANINGTSGGGSGSGGSVGGSGGGVGSGSGSNNNHQGGHSNSESSNLNRKCSESTEEISPGAEIFNNLRNANNNHFLKLKNHFAAALQENDLLSNLYKERLQLQIEVLKLRREKLSQELNNANQSNGVIRPKIVKCGLRLLRGGRNMIGHYRNLRPTVLNRNRLLGGAFSSRSVKRLNSVEKNGGSGESAIVNNVNHHNNHPSESENENVKNDRVEEEDEEEEEHKDQLLNNHVDEKCISKSKVDLVKKELDGKCLVNGDGAAAGEDPISDVDEDES